MKWKPYDYKEDPYARYLIVSDAGYAVMQCVVGETPINRHLAFKGFPGTSQCRVLGGYDSKKEAKAACDTHYSQTREVETA